MRNHLQLAALVVIAVHMIGCSADRGEDETVDQSKAFAFSGVTVIDGRGGEALTNYTVVVRNGLIDAVRPAGTVDLEGVTEINSNGKYLIPGLWDLHAHTFAENAVYDLYLEAGVTTIRDMGCSAECTEQLQQRREISKLEPATGPRMTISGPMIDGDSPYDGYAAHHQISIKTIPNAIDMLKDLKVDFVKVRDFLSAEEFYAAADAADAAGLRMAGHIPTAVRAQDAVRAGMHTVEHEGSLFGGLLLATSADEDALRLEMFQYMQEAVESGDVEELYAKALGADFLGRMVQSYDPDKAADLIQSFVDSGAAIVPTFIVQDPQLRSSNPVFNGRDRASDPAMQLVPENVKDKWRATAETYVLDQAFSVADLEAMEQQYILLMALVGQMHRAGVPVLAGTDASFPDYSPWVWLGYGSHDELELLVKSGLTPAEAIAASSGRAASHLGVENVGTIEEGKVADLVLLAANPLADIRNTTKIVDVIFGGEFVDREALAKRRNEVLLDSQ